MSLSVSLVAMPWQAIESPSLPIGLLKAACEAAGRTSPHSHHGSLRWVEHLMDHTGEELGPSEYVDVAENGLFHGLGDWVFTGVLHDDPDFGVAELKAYAGHVGLDIATVTRMREFAEGYVDLMAAEILARRPDVVGFSTTFMQNVPSLAVAKRIKELAPGTVVVFGGGNCDGPMGAALHRNFPFVDLVVRGEGEVAFPALLDAVERGTGLAQVPGLCWWDGDSQRVNRQAGPLPPGRIPVPDFADWFDTVAQSPVDEHIEPKLVVETARGCWWGEVHHCTFCGLNGTSMKFRSKSPDQVLAELEHLVRAHEVLDLIMVDNIIDNTYFGTVLPKVAELGWDLRVHYEVKSNLRPAEIAALRDAGVAHVQPGIESLVSPVLKIMDKGVTGVRNVRTLRDCESAGLTVTWNWLYGFPEEDFADYEPVLAQIPALAHLQYPAGAARIVLERFSPYFENPAMGFAHRQTAACYRHVYRMPEADLHEMVYLFDTPPRGIAEHQAKDLRESLRDWEERYADSSLRRIDVDGAIVLRDRRAGWPAVDHVIERPGLRAGYAELEHGRTPVALRRKLSEQGHTLTAAEIDDWLAGLRQRGLVFEERGTFLALATSGTPVKVMGDA